MLGLIANNKPFCLDSLAGKGTLARRAGVQILQKSGIYINYEDQLSLWTFWTGPNNKDQILRTFWCRPNGSVDASDRTKYPAMHLASPVGLIICHSYSL